MAIEQYRVLRKSQQGEADAALMYKKLAAVVKDEEDRKAFLRLACAETGHESVFLGYTRKLARLKK